MAKKRKRRGIWIAMDGSRVRFELDRRQGLLVRRHGKRMKRVSFEMLYDVAVGQPQLNLPV